MITQPNNCAWQVIKWKLTCGLLNSHCAVAIYYTNNTEPMIFCTRSSLKARENLKDFLSVNGTFYGVGGTGIFPKRHFIHFWSVATEKLSTLIIDFVCQTTWFVFILTYWDFLDCSSWFCRLSSDKMKQFTEAFQAQVNSNNSSLYILPTECCNLMVRIFLENQEYPCLLQWHCPAFAFCQRPWNFVESRY